VTEDTPEQTRIFRALTEYGYLSPKALKRAPEVLTLRCAACIKAGQRTPRTLGVVVSTSVGLLLRADQPRRRQYFVENPSGPESEWDWREKPDRKNLPLWHFLGDPLGPNARWFVTCDRHSRRPLPSQSELATAARDRRVTLLDC
jgi:hypothetical protein